MTKKAFDRFMLATDNGHNPKLARFSDAEFRAVVQGVWPIAARATPRGAFMIGNLPATANDVVFLAPSVSKRAASAAIDKLRALGMLEHDDELGAEWVHDWHDVNPSPRGDNTSAERSKRYRERQRHASVTPASRRDDRDGHGAVTGGEVKKIEVEAPLPPKGGRSVTALDPDAYPDDLDATLRPAADAVMAILQRLADAKQAKPVSRAAVGRALLSFPNRDYTAVASDVEHYWIHGVGAPRRMKDVVLTYRNRLDGAPTVLRAASTSNGHESAADIAARFNTAQAELKKTIAPREDAA